MRIAIAIDDMIVNLIEAPDLTIAALLFAGADFFDADAIEAGVGWVWDGAAWSPPPPPPLSPISPRQMLIGLLSIGITEDMVLAELETIADPQERAIALIEWHKAGMIERDHPLVADLAVTFALPAEQVDALWRWAAGL